MTGIWRSFVIAPLTGGGPIDGAGGAAELAVAVTDPVMVSSNVTVTFHLRPAGIEPGPDFTVAVLPDTQYYTAGINGGVPACFAAQTDWIVRERLGRNVVFVTHVGDVVEHGDNGGTNTEWLAAADALYRLEDSAATGLPDGIPSGIALGNHDQTPNGAVGGATLCYNEMFGAGHFAGRAYYGGHYGTNNDSHYEWFAAGALEFVVLHLEYNASTDPAAVAWAGEVLQTNAGRRAILVTHSLINAGFPGAFTAEGRLLYDALKVHPNLFLMLGGHAVGEGRREDVFEGRTVHTLLADYQGRASGGNGWLRLLQFSPSNQVMRVRTYSPWLDQFETDADSAFDLPCDLAGGGPFTRSGQGAVFLSGPDEPVVMTCFNLVSAAAYEWFVTVADGLRVQSSPVWRFVTGDVGESNRLALRVTLRLTPAGELEFSWPSVAGRAYFVCGKDDLAEPGWSDISGKLEAGSEWTTWTSPSPADTRMRFFVVRLADPGE